MEYSSTDFPAASPPPEGTSPLPPPRTDLRWRLDAFVRHPQAMAAALAILIGYASVFSALVAWRASLASIDASRYESLAVQQQARVQQIERDLGGLIAQDLRFVNVFQEHALAARELRAQAEELRANSPDQADEADILDLQSQARLDLARAVEPFFLGAGGARLGEDGTVTYDVAYVRTNLEAGNVELRELRTQRTAELGARADARSVSLIGVAALVVAALFFLTIAQVSRSRGRVRQVFFSGGSVLVLVGTFSFILVELLA